MPAIDRRSVPSAAQTNIAAFLSVAQTKYRLRPVDLFVVQDLVEGGDRSWEGFTRVVLCLEALGKKVSSEKVRARAPQLNRR